MLESFGKRGSGICSSKLLPCDAGKIIESSIGDAVFTIDKTSIYTCVFISLPLLIHKIAYRLFCTFLFNWYILEIFFSGMYIHNFASYCQLPSAEAVSIYISTCSVSLFVVLHPVLFITKALLPFLANSLFKDHPPNISDTWQHLYTHACTHTLSSPSSTKLG